jgi:hypothetical protein
MVVKLLVNSCGIRGIGRVLGISPTTVLKRIINAAQSLPKPATMALGKTPDGACVVNAQKCISKKNPA